MPSTSVLPKYIDRKRARHGQPLDLETLEEHRLLGISLPKHKDERPVPIQKPKSSWETHKMATKILNGGPRPTNTLTTSHARQKSALNYTAGSPRPLQIRTVRGSNVKDHPSESAVSSQFELVPSAKRRKVEHVKLDSSSNSDVSIDDPMKGLSPRNITFRSRPNNSSCSSLSSSSHGRSSGRVTKSFIGGVPEYTKVEEMMNSNSKTKGRLTRIRSGKSHSKDSSIPELRPSQADRDQGDCKPLGEEESVDTRPSYDEQVSRTYEEPHINGVNGDKVPKSTSERSPYWIAPQNSSLSGQTSCSEKKVLQYKTPPKPLMSRQFIADDGKRRGDAALASSPDELLSETTVGQHVKQVNHALNKRNQREHSPITLLSNSNELSLSKDKVGLDPSNIKATQFGASRSEKRLLRGQEARPPWSLDVVAINLPGYPQSYRNHNLGLVHDEKKGNFVMHQEGKPLRIDNIVPVINLNKLYKVIFEEDGCRIRFESSKEEGADNILDIEIAREKDKQRFLTRLQEGCRVKVKGYSREKLEKMFELRRKQPYFSKVANKQNAAGRNDHPSPVLADMQAFTSAGSTHIPRTKIVDDLLQRAGEPEHIPQSRPLSMLPTGPNEVSKSPSKDNSGISCILRGLKPELPEQNSHLRRSSRISDSSSNICGNIRARLEEPEIEKYSKVHGLGRKWKKPLTYPKTGRKKATVDFVDLERLDEGEMLNDTLVTFHMRSLEHQAEQTRPDLAKRVYFFSTFFYQRLTDFAKGTKEVNYSAVQSWTRAVDIFTYDYVVVPINEAAHWYLAIICNLPALDRRVSLSDEDDKTASRDCSRAPSIVSPLELEQAVKKSIEQLDSQPEDPVERGTRESFAEMKLDSDETQLHDHVNDEVEAYGDQNRKSDEGEMLDDPEEGVWHPPSSKAGTVEVPSTHETNEPAKHLESMKKVRASLKKSKRKSLPPIAHTDPNRPLIVTFDSLGAPHGNTIRFLKEYLIREMDAKRGSTNMDIGSIQGVNAKCIPQQSNFSDCGLYMLGYLDKFMGDGPSTFIRKTIKRQYTKEDWSELVPSRMRSNLRDRLLKLGAQHDEERRAAKAKGKKDGGEPKASSPASSSAPLANYQERINASSKATSSRTSPELPVPLTRRQVLETAQPLQETVSYDVADSLSSREHKIEREGHDHEKDSHSRKPLENLIPIKTPSIVVVHSQSQDHTQPCLPSSQIPEQLPEERNTSPALPVEVKDSQEPTPKPKVDPPLETSSKRPQRTENRQDETQMKVEPLEVQSRRAAKPAEPPSPKRKRQNIRSRDSDSPILETDAVLPAKKRNKTQRAKQHGEMTMSEGRDIISID